MQPPVPLPPPPCTHASNIDEVVMVLKKEIVKTQSSSNEAAEKGPEYRQMLVGAIHTCAARFPDVSSGGIHEGAGAKGPRSRSHRAYFLGAGLL